MHAPAAPARTAACPPVLVWLGITTLRQTAFSSAPALREKGYPHPERALGEKISTKVCFVIAPVATRGRQRGYARKAVLLVRQPRVCAAPLYIYIFVYI